MAHWMAKLKLRSRAIYHIAQYVVFCLSCMDVAETMNGGMPCLDTFVDFVLPSNLMTREIKGWFPQLIMPLISCSDVL